MRYYFASVGKGNMTCFDCVTSQNIVMTSGRVKPSLFLLWGTETCGRRERHRAGRRKETLRERALTTMKGGLAEFRGFAEIIHGLCRPMMSVKAWHNDAGS
jgi:hypothetical protein